MTDAPDGLPKRIGRYAVVRPLSKGGMALVYEAKREVLGGVAPRVAIKIILPDYAGSSTFRDLFINEARLGAALQHQNLVQILDFDQDGDRYFLVMEYVDGLTLSRMVALAARHDVRVPMQVICEIGRQACEGLHYLHQAVDNKGRALNMIHRDIKPSNLMVTSEGGVKILDFGISKGRLRTERSGSVKGTWGYMAPEQAAGVRIAPNVDVFSLGIVLYEMASRKSMFKGRSEDEIRQMLDRDHASRVAATLDPSYAPLAGVLARALHRDPLQRFATAAEMGRHLADLLPDPVTVRDEMVRFFENVQEIARQERPRLARVEPTEASSATSRRSLFTLDAGNHPANQRTVLLSALVGLVTVVSAFVVGFLAMRGLEVGVAEPASPEAVGGLPEVGSLPPVERKPSQPEPSVAEPAQTPPDATREVLGVDEAWIVLGCEDCVSLYLDGRYVQPSRAERHRVKVGTHVVAWVLPDSVSKSKSYEVQPGEEVRAILDARGNLK